MRGTNIAEKRRANGAAGSRRVALATGGTAGHVTPALAVAEAYRAARPDTSVVFIGSASGFEQRLVAAHGYHFETIPAAPLYGVTAWRRLQAFSHLAAGVRRARRVLARNDVQLVIGFGGYASAGAVLAARSLGLAVAVHDANATPGLTNRLLAHVVDRILLGWDGAAQHVAAGRSRCTGTPIRPALAALAGAPHRPPDAARARLLVYGGSQGSPFLNRHAPELAAVLRPDRARGRGAARERTRAAAGGARSLCGTWRRGGRGTARATTSPPRTAGRMSPSPPPAPSRSPSWRRRACPRCSSRWRPPPTITRPATRRSSPPPPERRGCARKRGTRPLVGRQLAALLRDRDAWRGLSERTARLARADAAAAVVAECEALLVSSSRIVEGGAPSPPGAGRSAGHGAGADGAAPSEGSPPPRSSRDRPRRRCARRPCGNGSWHGRRET